MSEIVAVPNYILEEVDGRLDDALPEEASDEDRDALRSELLAFVDQHGYVPDFTVERT